MSSHLGTYSLHADNIFCPRCGNTGRMHWADTPVAADRQLMTIEGGFHERLPNAVPYRIELVCDNCGAAQPEAVQDGLRQP